MHPLLPSPHSVAQDPATVTIDKLEQHRDRDSNSILKKIMSEETGKEVSTTNSYAVDLRIMSAADNKSVCAVG